MPGLGIFEAETVLEAEKKLINTSGTICAKLTSDSANIPVTGYEIHAGVTHGKALSRPFLQLQNRTDGAVSEDGQVAGCYLHGLFDHPDACQYLLQWAGLQDAESFDIKALYDESINRIADAIEQHTDLKLLEQILRLPEGSLR